MKTLLFVCFIAIMSCVNASETWNVCQLKSKREVRREARQKEKAEERKVSNDANRLATRTKTRKTQRDKNEKVESKWVPEFKAFMDSAMMQARVTMTKKGYNYVNVEQLMLTPENYRGKKVVFLTRFFNYETKFYNYMLERRIDGNAYLMPETLSPLPLILLKKNSKTEHSNLKSGDYIFVYGKVAEDRLDNETRTRVFHIVLDGMTKLDVPKTLMKGKKTSKDKDEEASDDVFNDEIEQKTTKKSSQKAEKKDEERPDWL